MVSRLERLHQALTASSTLDFQPRRDGGRFFVLVEPFHRVLIPIRTSQGHMMASRAAVVQRTSRSIPTKLRPLLDDR